MSAARNTPFLRLSAHYSTNNKFKKLVIPGGNTTLRKRFERPPPPTSEIPWRPLRSSEDWCNEWPSAASFNSSVPLPLRQGVVRNKSENEGIIPHAVCNHEITKIPNFLHLTPKHIASQCKAIKVFCTKWPSDLKTDADVDKHYPVSVTSRDYVMSGPSIRDDRARHVTIRLPVAKLGLWGSRLEKFRLLVGDDRLEGEGKEKMLVLHADRCPTRRQNYNYLQYVVTALTRESMKKHPWEKQMTREDRLSFHWESSESKKKICELLEKKGEEVKKKKKEVNAYGKVLTTMIDEGESEEILDEYKEKVMKLLKLKRAEG